ncbi:hypothetical protein [Sphingopyxis sp. JAI128]|uniref:hypothetical protein n=1 Tax=Sphingopyxis sp. JAI128 TaxID=2723066 RepID=UPI0016110F74|nr:hypothetical protein [Sphingopyxis sp. JAI128]MBB6425172.1 hypothetical protein [Sphingopyxis sp. JAI128]
MLPYGLPAATPDIATLLTQPAAAQPAAFTWGAGGQRMTPEDIAAQRKRATGMMQGDYSPIQSPWQGLARVAGNINGALEMRNANRAAEANAADGARMAQALAAQARFNSDPAPISGGGLFGLRGKAF